MDSVKMANSGLKPHAEGHAFRKEEMDAMLELASLGIKHLLEKQQEALENYL